MFTKFKNQLLIILSAVLASLLIMAGAFLLTPEKEAHAADATLYWGLSGSDEFNQKLTISSSSSGAATTLYSGNAPWRNTDMGKVTSIEIVGNVNAPSNMVSWFQGCSRITTINLSGLNTSGVTNMSFLFYNCTKLTSITLSDFNTANVTNMESMFGLCSSLETIDISSFNTSAVTNASNMFEDCNSLQTINTPATVGSVALPLPCTYLRDNLYPTKSITDVSKNSTLTRHDDHVGGTATCTKKAKCLVCNEYYGNFADHVGGTATCTARAVCSVCNQAYGEPLGHDLNTAWSYDGETHWHACANCDSKVDEEAHTFVNGVCECGYTAGLYWKLAGGTLTLSSVKSDDGFELYTNLSEAWENDKGNIRTVAVDGNACAPENMSQWFAGCCMLSGVDLSNLDTSNVTDMSFLFSGCDMLTTVNVQNLDTSNVTDMSYIFNGCSSLTSIGLLLSQDFSTASVTNMCGMFKNCDKLTYLSFTTQYFPNFSTANVTNMCEMFNGCEELGSLYVSIFDTSNVTDMSYMFSNCNHLLSLDLSNFEIASGTDVSYMLQSCAVLNTVTVPQNIGADVSIELPCNYYNGERNEIIADITSLDASTAETTVTLVRHADHVEQTAATCTAKAVCSICGNEYGDFAEHDWSEEWSSDENSHWHECNNCDVKNAEYTHTYTTGGHCSVCNNVAELYWGVDDDGVLTLSSYKTDAVPNNYSSSTKWNTYSTSITSVTVDRYAYAPGSMGAWFYNCLNLTSVDLSNLDTTNVTSMSYMFHSCSSLTSLDLSSFDTENVTDMGWMFYGCSQLTQLNLSSFDMTKVTDVGHMFEGCSSLNKIFTPATIVCPLPLPDATSLWWNENRNAIITGAITSDDAANTIYLHTHAWDTEWSYDETNHWHECTVCGEKGSEEIHTFVNGECECGYTAYFEVTANNVSTYYVTIEEAFTAASSAGTATLKMYADAEISSTLEVAEGKNIILDLNGNMLKMSEDGNGSVIIVCGTFTLEDNGGGTSSHSIINHATNTSVEVIGGVICGGNSALGGGGVYVSGVNAKFTMTSGKISGNTAKYNGGGVFVTNSGTFEMSGTAEISYNVAKTDSRGGGVYLSGGTFKMSGGAISSNGSTLGGGVYLSGGTVEMSGGTINANFALDGGGVYLSGGTFKVSGAVNITGNYHLFYNTANNVYLWGSKNVTVTGALTDPDDPATKAQIGVYNTGAVATDFTQEGDPADFFIPDVSTNNCIYADEGTVYIGTHTMEWVYDNENHWRECSACGENEGVEAAHTFAGGECTVCHYDASDLYWAIKTEDDEVKLILSYYKIDEDFNKYDYMYTTWDSSGSEIISVTVETYAYAPEEMGWWFSFCENLEDADLKGLDTSRVTFMGGLFYLCESLTSVDLSELDTSKVENLGDMFNGCASITSIDLSSFDLSAANNIGGMFKDCTSLTSIILPSFDNADNIDNMDYLFAGCASLTAIDELTKLKTAGVEKFSHMFDGCSNLVKLDLSSFNTSGVEYEEYVQYMFAGCASLTEIKTPATVGSVSLPLPDKFVYWTEEGASVCITEIASKDAGKTITRHITCTPSAEVTENAVEADCTTIGGYDTVVYCSVCGDEISRTHTEIPALGHDYVSGVCIRCGDDATALYWGLNGGTLTLSSHNSTATPNLYSAIIVSGKYHPAWYADRDDITSVTVAGYAYAPVSMAYWFNDCVNLAAVDLAGLDTSRTTDMSYLFYKCNNASFTSLDVTNFNTEKVTDMSFMFYDCRNVTALDVTDFDTSEVTNMHCMFWGCSNLTELDVTHFDTANVTNMNYMFAFCSSLTELDVSGFNTANATDMGGMFRACGELTALDVSGFVTEKVTDMSEMFKGCAKLNGLDVTNFNTATVAYMSSMFSGCSSLTAIDVTGFNTEKITNMSDMFYYCENLTSLDLSSFDTSKVTNMSYMFYNCNSLTSLDLSYFDASAVTNAFAMLSGCNFTTVQTPKAVGTTALPLPCRFWNGSADIEEITSDEINKTVYRHNLHSYGEWQNKVDPKCTVEGVEAHKDCTVCHKHFNSSGKEITVTIAPLGHDFTGSWHSDGDGHWHVCLRENCSVSDTKTEHSSTNTDCTEDTVCTACGYLMKSAEEAHSFSDGWTAGINTHWHACTNVGCEGRQDEADHDYENGECTACHDIADFEVTEDGAVNCYKTITEAFEAVENAATVKMFADAEISATLTVEAGKEITLDLNGCMLTMTDSGSVIIVNGSFILEDNGDETLSCGVITGGSSEYGGGLYVAENGSFTMNGGAVSGNAASEDGGGVYVAENGSFTMTGGAISGNAASEDGGGVYVAENGSFTMNGGIISENAVNIGGGGVCVESGSFTMTGGTITENSTVDSGGGVYVGGGSFTMTGGTIIENQAGAGGGVCVNGGSFTMSGTAEISKNIADSMLGLGGGVYFFGKMDDDGELSTDSAFTMNGGSVNENTAVLGGGVCVMGMFTMSCGEINGNTGTYGAGGVLLMVGTFEMSGGTVSGNVQTDDMGLGFCGGVCVGTEFMQVEEIETTFKVSGAPVITGNTAVIDGATVENNVCLFNYNTITVTGTLTNPDDPAEKAQIGIFSTGAVITGFTQNGNPTDYFIPDNPENNCIFISDNENGTVTIGVHAVCTATCVAKEQCVNCGEEWGEIDPDNHSFGNWQNEVAANCTETGVKGHKDCALCGKHFDSNGTTEITDLTIAALEHDFTGSWQSDGEGHWHVCRNTDCTATDTKADHEYTLNIATETYLKSAATCTAKAVYYKSCVCGMHGMETFEYGELAPHTSAEAVSENEVAATCIKAGSYDEVVYCSVCGEELGRTQKSTDINPDAHDYGQWQNEVAADCTETGVKGHKDCELCHKHFDSGNVAITDLIIAINDNHNWGNGTVTKQPTCTEEGVKTFTCTHNSEHAKTESIKALGHTEVSDDNAVASTCTQTGLTASTHCSVCDTVIEEQTVVDALGHSFGEWEITKEATETEEGEERRVCENDDAHYETRTLPKLTPAVPEPSAPAEKSKSYLWLLWLLIPLAVGVGVALGIWLYKKDKKNKKL